MFETQKQLRWSKLKVGLVITIAFLVLCLAVLFAGNIQSLISKKVELKIQFKDVEGLRTGAPVWVLGIEEGYVKQIALSPTYGVIITIAINKNSLRFIKQDSEATILTMGLLGDKYVELSTGTPQAEPVHPGETLKGTTEMGLRSIVETSSKTIETMHSFIKRLDDLVAKIETGHGTLAKFIEDPSVFNNLKKTTEHLSAITEEIKNSRGTLKLLIENPSLYNKALAAASSVEEFSKTLSHGHGTLKELIENPELYQNFNRDLKQLSDILERIERGEGVAGALIKDRELAKELKDTVAELKELLKDIKEHPKKYFKFSLF